MGALLRTEAAERSRLLRVRGYDVALDLTRGGDVFGSTARITFESAEPGATTFLDLAAARVDSIVLNGRPVDVSAIADERVRLADLTATNELVVTAEFRYSHEGEGLHRAIDAADGEAYVWAETCVNHARRIFACFDQPDLKAPLRLRVRAPDHWTVVSHGAGEPDDDGTWAFAETPPLSTYLMCVVGGPFHSVYETHGEIPLGLHVRKSLGEHLDADELFTETRQSFDFYHGLFGVPYPFGKYDQVFLPEYEFGAMENPGCVKFTDKFIYRSRVTDDERALRAIVIAHEMAHMWFGDLVTLRWWDDLWLNESFAEYMGTLAVDESMRFTDRWAWFCATMKAWGYRQDELPSTHPIADDVADTAVALLNLDGISYAKGAGALKQLVAWVGFDAFVEGLKVYFDRHAYANTTLADLLAALEPASGRDLAAWSREWLETAGVNVLRPEAIEDGGTYRSVAVLQEAPADQPTLRRHRIAIGLYDRDGDRLVRRDRVEADIEGARTEVAALAGIAVPDLLLLNDDDLTWAKVRLDARSLAAIRGGGLAGIEEALPRALIWASLWDMVRDAELSAGGYLSFVLDSIGAERDIALIEDALKRARTAIDSYGRPEEREARLAALAERTRDLLAATDQGSDLQVTYARAHVRSAAGASDAARIAGWLAGTAVPAGLAVDHELRWLIVRRLAVLGAIDEDAIAVELERDPTSNGTEWAAGARASLPSADAKARTWEAIMDPNGLSYPVLRATVRDFWHREQLDLCTPYVEPYLAGVPGIWRSRSAEVAWEFTSSMFPALLVSTETVALVDRTLATDLDDAPRRLLVEGRADIERAIRAREADRAEEPVGAS
jgi:aminopeptidase N